MLPIKELISLTFDPGPRFLILSILDLLTDMLPLEIDFGVLLLLIRDFKESLLKHKLVNSYFQIMADASKALLSEEPQCLISPSFFGEISTINLLVPSFTFLIFVSVF